MTIDPRHIAALEAAALDLDAAATPTRSDVFTSCGVHAADLRDAIKAALARATASEAAPVATAKPFGWAYMLHNGEWKFTDTDPSAWSATATALFTAPPAPAHSAEKATEGAANDTKPNTIEVGKPMPYWCPACQAIPRAGYCKLAGCPTAPLPSRDQAPDGGEQ